jgi:hypothetical protein
MSSGDVIFSDGAEQDFHPFESATAATHLVADQKLNPAVRG